jgi:Asp-tRNA(Asn)/Glu-tRNA(Gln) amidotransferase A subunit family amidase
MSFATIARSLLATTIGFSVTVPNVANAAIVNVEELTVKDVQAGLKGSKFTSVDLVESFLARINTYESTYNAFISFNPDALETAKALDREYKTTGPRSPLHGVPIVIKDAIDIAGIPTTNGYAKFSSTAGGVDLIPEFDAPLVARLKAAGAVIVGKTNLPAFAANGTRANTSFAGPTYNAYDLTLAPGASSSGTATAVSASFAVLGMAEETGGSIQNPAAAQGLVSIKPTFALVPNTGVAPLAGSTRDVVGPHTKTVYDAAVTLDILAGVDSGDPKTIAAKGKLPLGGYTTALSDTALKGKRIGLFGMGFKKVQLTPETQKLYDRAIAVLKKQGATVITDPFAGTGFADLSPTGSFDLRGLETLPYDYNQYLKRLGSSAAIGSFAEIEKVTGVNIFAEGQPLSFLRSLPNFDKYVANPEQLPIEDFLKVRQQFLSVFLRVMDENQLDGLVFPQMYAPVPPLEGTEEYPSTTVSEINILGSPGITVPAGFYENGSPFSLLFLGKPFSEAELLGLAYDYEQATMLRQAPTLVQKPLVIGGTMIFAGVSLQRLLIE